MSKETDRKFVLMAFRIIGDFGVTIAVPVVLFAYLGRLADMRLGTSPWLTVLGFALAAGVTAVMIRRKAKRYGQEYEGLIQEEKKDTPNSTQ